MQTSKAIRSSFIDFFKDRRHSFVPSAPVVPLDDPTLLFTNAGMNQFKDIFLGLTGSQWKRAVNSQKCIRVSGKHNDLEEVGIDTYHHTFFEMLGNWSFDDYFKEDTIRWAWELLTEVYGIDADVLYATYFGGDPDDGSQADTETAKLWTKVTNITAERVLPFGKKDNFWEMGETGPCGPCSEIHIDLGPQRCDMGHVPGHKCRVNAGCGRFIELWNLVFIQFNRMPDGQLVKLPANYVDTGAGLERICSVLQNKHSNYDTDLFMPIIEAVSDLAGQKYTSKLDSKTDCAFRVIADHIRSLSFAITDGVTLSNEGRGYVMRRILRRAARFGRVLDMHEPFMYKLVDVVRDHMGEAFGEIVQRSEHVKTVIQAEEAGFGRTLDRGLEIFNTAAKKAKKSKSKTVSGADAFQLYDTYGFPLDLTELMARERELKIDKNGFDELMEQQRQRARAARKSTGSMDQLAGVELPTTDDNGKYETDQCHTRLLGVIETDGYRTEGLYSDTDETDGFVLDSTCFYAESGGQQGDSGIIESDTGRFEILETRKIANCVIHHGQLVSGEFAIGSGVTATVDAHRHACKKNHTATHLLQWALQQELGDSVRQQGSQVSPGYLRFDFTYPKAVSGDQLAKIEQLVREKIEESSPVHCAVMGIDEAKKLGAMALFGEKYGSDVRVVAIGSDGKDILQAFSREFCGGTHVNNTGEIGSFKVLKEESISTGVRRITALTGDALVAHLLEQGDIVEKLSAMLKVPDEQVVSRVQKLLDDNKDLGKKLKAAAKQGSSDTMADAKKLLENCKKLGDVSIIVGEISPGPVEQVRSAMDMLKKKAKSAVVVLGIAENPDKVTLIAGVTDDLIKKGLKAGDIIKQIAPIVEGGGGGRPQMAQAGGKNAAKLGQALDKAAELIESKL